MPSKSTNKSSVTIDSATNGQYHHASKQMAVECTSHWDDLESMERNQEEYKRFLEANRNALQKSATVELRSDDSESASKKREYASGLDTPRKKHKSDTGAQAAPTAPYGSITRVPKEGQQVTWHALPGWVTGTVMEVVYNEKRVDGKKVKASKEDPRVVLKSETSGKICIHKPEAVCFK